MSEQLLVLLTKMIEQIQGNVFTYTTKHKETQALSTENCLRQVQENRQIIIKEERSKEEDRQEEAYVKKKCFVQNVYVDLKQRHQNDENQEDFYVGRSWQTLNFKTNKICARYVGPYFTYNPHYGFVAK